MILTMRKKFYRFCKFDYIEFALHVRNQIEICSDIKLSFMQADITGKLLNIDVFLSVFLWASTSEKIYSERWKSSLLILLWDILAVWTYVLVHRIFKSYFILFYPFQTKLTLGLMWKSHNEHKVFFSVLYIEITIEKCAYIIVKGTLILRIE